MRFSIARLTSALGLLLVFSAPAAAQQTAIPLNTGYRLCFDYQQAPTPNLVFKSYRDGVQLGADIPASALTAGVACIEQPGFSTAGTHRLEVTARDDGGESAKSVPLDVRVGPPPAPGAPRITIVTTTAGVLEPQTDGTFKLRIESTKTEVVQ